MTDAYPPTVGAEPPPQVNGSGGLSAGGSGRRSGQRSRDSRGGWFGGRPRRGSGEAAAADGARPAMRQGREAVRRRRNRRHLTVTAVLAAVLVGAVLVVVWTLGRPETPGAAPAPTPTPSSTWFDQQRTLLVQVRDDDGLTTGTVLLAVGGGPGSVVQLTLPPNLTVDVAGAGTVTLANAARLPDTLASVDAVSDLLGVRVDGGLALDRLAFAGLVDAIGGVTMDVATGLTRTTPDGKTTLLVPAGRQTLSGVAAADYVTTLGPGEGQAALTARFVAVLDEVIRRLPEDPPRLRAVLTSLGALSRTTIPTDDLTAMLLELRSRLLAGAPKTDELPTTSLDIAIPPTSRIRARDAAALTRDLFPEALRDASDGTTRVRVLVQNGVGTPGLGGLARDRLYEGGLTYVNGGNADSFGHTDTVVVVAADDPQGPKNAAAVVAALDVPPSAVRVSEQTQRIADVVVVLGSDFVDGSPA
ncbi:MAG: LytR family transcriptional regulator [Actinomycetota bacterium]|nr:MAG: LytR family transcriptional regulator [Actinomycetota bacterium]